ncbi:Bax inhibitor-1/YccA family protein [Treponema pectinovorum]|uniref:Bax inhibitor-1/YccA family protein n=1 Tax=Treponema pectinovorum TaxID=164 RepID=UPI0011CA368E|nr:Bax inhibitor-1/YccA family protein [Treponema pectinovorum]
MTETRAVRLTDIEKSRFLARTYGWMAFALFLSAVVAYITALNIFSQTPDGRLVFTSFGRALFGKSNFGFLALCILEFAIVIWLTAKIRTMSVASAIAGFVLYSVVNGITLSSIFAIYEVSSIANAFLATSITFAVMCIYGTFTKKDLSKMARYLYMVLLGIILASVLHFVIAMIAKAPLTMLDLLISIATIIVFTGLTAYDSQKILKTAQMAKDSADYKKVSILAALELYLDFVNLLLALLRLFGKRRN